MISLVLHSGWGLTFVVGLAAGCVAGWVFHREFGGGSQSAQERSALPGSPSYPALPERQRAAILTGQVRGITGAAGSRAITRDGS